MLTPGADTLSPCVVTLHLVLVAQGSGAQALSHGCGDVGVGQPQATALCQPGRVVEVQARG